MSVPPASASARSKAPGRQPAGSRGGGLRALTGEVGSWGPQLVGRARPGRGWLLAGAVLLAVAVGIGAWKATRGASGATIRHVQIVGLNGTDQREIAAALTSAALGQPTNAVSLDQLRGAVAPFPMVHDLSVRPRSATGVVITVGERFPVALVQTPSGRTAVSADGAVLGNTLSTTHVPTIIVPVLPDGQIRDARTLSEVTLLGDAPLVLLHRAARAYYGPQGLTVAMRNGLLIFFGDATRPVAKWLGAEAVIADSRAAGALYVDVRLPDRPAAGGLPQSDAAATGVDPTEAELATELQDAVSGVTASAGAPSGVQSASVPSLGDAAGSSAAAPAGIVTTLPGTPATTPSSTDASSATTPADASTAPLSTDGTSSASSDSPASTTPASTDGTAPASSDSPASTTPASTDGTAPASSDSSASTTPASSDGATSASTDSGASTVPGSTDQTAPTSTDASDAGSASGGAAQAPAATVDASTSTGG